MSEKRPIHIETNERRSADGAFSIAPLMAMIDERFGQAQDNTFTASELEQLARETESMRCKMHDDDVYGAEVFVVMTDDAYVYDTGSVKEGEVPPKITIEGKVFYGYIHRIAAEPLPDNPEVMALIARVEAYDEMMTKGTHTYEVPLAIEASVYGSVRLTDAPVPVGESDVGVAVQAMYGSELESEEQDAMHSLIDIVEKDIFEGKTIDTSIIEETIVKLRENKLLTDVDSFVTACNYYLQKCIHDRDPWRVAPEGMMERYKDGEGYYVLESGERRGSEQWVYDELTVIGMDVRVQRNGQPRCVVYALSEDEVLYGRHRGRADSLLLYRGDYG